MRTSIVLGSRRSQLALIQSESVAEKLREANPGIEVTIRKIVTEGDRNRRVPLEKVSSIGIFVKELEAALLDGRIDIAVHSLKDVPSDIPEGLCLLAVTARQDCRDVLIARAGLDALSPGSKIGTGSLRRAVQLTQYRPDLEVSSIRGNVETRLRKVTSGELDGVIVAAAAIARLNMNNRITEYLPVDRFLPAVGQGALVIEGRDDDEDVAELVKPINHLPTWQSVIAERVFLKALGGGCRAPIAALASVRDNVVKLDGMIAAPHGRKMLRGTEEGSASQPDEVGVRLAQRLLNQGASDFIDEVRVK